MGCNQLTGLGRQAIRTLYAIKDGQTAEIQLTIIPSHVATKHVLFVPLTAIMQNAYTDQFYVGVPALAGHR